MAVHLIDAMADLSNAQCYSVLAAMTLVFTAVLWLLVPWINRHMTDTEVTTATE